MKRKKIRIGTLIGFVLWICLMLCSGTVYAEESMDLLLQDSGAAALADGIDGAIQSELEQYGISVEEPETVKGFGLPEVFQAVKDALQARITAPMRLLLLFCAVILCSALLHAVQQGRNGAICEMIGVMGAVTAGAEPICTCFQQVKDTLGQCSDFMTLFTPIFSAMLTATGQIGTAAAYQTGTMMLTNIILQILDKLLLPLLSMSFAIAIADAVHTEHTLGGLLQLTKTIVTWSIGFLMSIFIGVISIQSVVNGAADGFATKTTKYVVSNFVPIVGGAVSDAYATVLGSIQVLKSMTGAVGIVVLLMIFLPIFLEVILYRLALQIAAALAELFSVQQIAKFLKGAEQVLSMTFAILTCFAILFLVTIALLLLISKQSF